MTEDAVSQSSRAARRQALADPRRPDARRVARARSRASLGIAEFLRLDESDRAQRGRRAALDPGRRDRGHLRRRVPRGGYETAREVIARTFETRLSQLDPDAVGKGREDPPAGATCRRSAWPSRSTGSCRPWGAKQNLVFEVECLIEDPRRSRPGQRQHAPARRAAGRRGPAQADRGMNSVPLRHGRARGAAEHRQVEPAQQAGRAEDRHRVAQGADHAAHGDRHLHDRVVPVRVRRPARVPDAPRQRAEPGLEPAGDRRRARLRRRGVRGRSAALRRRKTAKCWRAFRKSSRWCWR